MFCEKCGKPVDMDKTVCEECAAKEEKLEQNEAIVLDQEEQPKKKKSGLLIGIVAAVAALAVLAVVLVMGPLKGLWLKSFGSPAEYMLYVEEKATAAGVQNFVQLYGENMEQMKGMDECTIQGDAHILLGDKLLTLLEQGLATEGTDMQLDFLGDIALDIETGWTENAFGMQLDLGLGDKDVIGAEVYFNEQDKTMIVGVPVLNSQYIQGPAAEIDLSNPGDTYALYQLLPTATKLGTVLDTYTGIALKYLEKVEMDNETVTVEGVKQNLTVLTLTLTAEDVGNMAIEILETAQTDKDLEAVLDAVSAYVNAIYEQQYASYKGVPGMVELIPEKVDLHAQMLEAIPDAIQQIRDDAQELSEGNYLQLTDYVDGGHALRGRTVEVFTENVSEGSLRYMNITDGSKWALELDLTKIEDVGLYLAGTYENNDGAITGAFDITVENVHYMTLEMTNCTKNQQQLKLIPTDAFLRDVLELEEDATALLGLASPCLELINSESAAAGKVELYLKAGDAMLAGVTLDATLSREATLTPPLGPFADVEDPEAMEKWEKSMDFEALLEKLTVAGVPEELIQTLLMSMMYA